VTPTHALFADQSHSIPDNLVALLGRIRAWNYSAEDRPISGGLFAAQRGLKARLNAPTEQVQHVRHPETAHNDARERK
jgi:hypothetical protein